MANYRRWARLWYSLRAAAAEFIDPSIIKEMEAIKTAKRDAGRKAHHAFHALWSHVAMGKPYEKRMWKELDGYLNLLGVQPGAKPQHSFSEAQPHPQTEKTKTQLKEKPRLQSLHQDEWRLERAAKFCETGYLLSIAATHPLIDRLGTLSVGLAVKKRGIEHWNFFIVAAAASAALSVLEGEVSGTEFESLKATLFRCKPESVDEHFLHLWTVNATSAVEDCTEFVRRTLADTPQGEAKRALSSAIGSWVIWNLLGAEPNLDDLPLASALGHLVASTYAPYWDRDEE